MPVGSVQKRCDAGRLKKCVRAGTRTPGLRSPAGVDTRGSPRRSAPVERNSARHENSLHAAPQPMWQRPYEQTPPARTQTQSPFHILPARTEQDTPPDAGGQEPSVSQCDRRAATSTQSGCRREVACRKTISAVAGGQRHSGRNEHKTSAKDHSLASTDQKHGSSRSDITLTALRDIIAATLQPLRKNLQPRSTRPDTPFHSFFQTNRQSGPILPCPAQALPQC